MNLFLAGAGKSYFAPRLTLNWQSVFFEIAQCAKTLRMSTPRNSSGLAVRIQLADRSQVMTHMHCLDEMIRPDHEVRAVWRYVSSLDLSAFYADIESVRGGAGRTAADPKILLALWVFATIEGIGSARRLAELCTRDFAYMWLCGDVGVNRDMLNTFRSAHPEALDGIMSETIGVLLHHELVSLKRVAQDGMRTRANAGKSSFRRVETLNEHLKDAQQQVENIRREDDDDHVGRSRQESARQRAAEDRLARLEQAVAEQQKLAQQREKRKKGSGVETRCSTTDPEARTMKMADGGYRPAYNLQFATACDSRIVVGVGATNEGTDSGQMTPMVEHLEATFGTRPEEYLVDGGFNSRADTTHLEGEGVKVYSPIKKEQQLLAECKDPYARQREDTDEYYQWRQRMQTAEAKAIYNERCSTAEFPHAGFRNRGLNQLPVRGLQKTRTIAVWHALVHNLKMILCHGWLPTVVGR